MSRKQPKRTAGKVAMFALSGFFIVTVVGGIGFGVASAGSTDDLAYNGAFGYDDATTQATYARRAGTVSSPIHQVSLDEQSVLTTPAIRSLDAGFQMVADVERAERERIEAENAAAIQRMEAEKAKLGVLTATTYEEAPQVVQGADQTADATLADDSVVEAYVEEPAQEDVGAMEYSLPAVDWTVGRDAFIEEWTARIDAYLAGSPLYGYGNVFAEAAWDNGIDPRFSPAISNTESSKGSVCFRSCNAWGWGNVSWPDWDTAIRAHVAGLAAGYGYSITLDGAYMYCPPTYVDWYNKTLEQMTLI